MLSCLEVGIICYRELAGGSVSLSRCPRGMIFVCYAPGYVLQWFESLSFVCFVMPAQWLRGASEDRVRARPLLHVPGVGFVSLLPGLSRCLCS